MINSVITSPLVSENQLKPVKASPKNMMHFGAAPVFKNILKNMPESQKDVFITNIYDRSVMAAGVSGEKTLTEIQMLNAFLKQGKSKSAANWIWSTIKKSGVIKAKRQIANYIEDNWKSVSKPEIDEMLKLKIV